MTAPATDALGRPVNPDTNLPYPSASAAQEQLADELLARLVDTPDLWTAPLSTARDLIRDALVEVAVRQHGRTLRALIEETREQAAAFEQDARVLAREAIESTDEPITPDRAASIAKLTTAARTLRVLHLHGFRA